jgi:hypothetical protein
MGVFVVKRRTDRLRLTRKFKRTGYPGAAADAFAGGVAIPMACSVLRGHYAYFVLPSNWDRLGAFYQETRRIWYRALNRRSQRWLPWERYVRSLERFPARFHESPILDRWPLAESGKISGGAECGEEQPIRLQSNW